MSNSYKKKKEMIGLKEIRKIADYEFKNVALLRTALTHSSYANEKKCACNERLEFLGDSVLGLSVSKFLYKRLSNVSEGILSKIRASLVCEESLAKNCKKAPGSVNICGSGAAKSCRAAGTEILFCPMRLKRCFAAIYLDSDFNTAEKWVISHMRNELEEGMKGKFYHDYKTMLQEAVQKKKPRYRNLQSDRRGRPGS